MSKFNVQYSIIMVLVLIDFKLNQVGLALIDYDSNEREYQFLYSKIRLE